MASGDEGTEQSDMGEEEVYPEDSDTGESIGGVNILVGIGGDLKPFGVSGCPCSTGCVLFLNMSFR